MALWNSVLHGTSHPGWLLIFINAILLIVTIDYSSAGGTLEKDSNTNLTLKDTRLKAELIVGGINFPTAMSFLGPNDILVLEKDNGTIRRITDGTLLEEPLLDLNVSGVGENGLTGIAVVNNDQKAIGNSTRIFLYFTETLNGDTMDPNAFSRNRLYRYDFTNDQFTNRKLILDLPTGNNIHNGGKIVIGFDQNVYVSTGDTGRYGANLRKTQNNGEGREPDGTGGILRITQDGRPVMENVTWILGSEYPLNLYYAYGIRNSFGMDFDPVTGSLWITDNGPSFGDEINLVKPGFNSGWNKVQGFWKNEAGEKGELDLNPEDLVDFNGKGEYSNPEFVWDFPVGLTALKFFNSTKLGEEYRNDIFVGDFNNGYIYHFDLNDNRTELSPAGPFQKLTDFQNDISEGEIFAQGPGGIMDILVGPDGYMYVLALFQKGSDCDPDAAGCVVDNNSQIKGAIFRIYSTASI